MFLQGNKTYNYYDFPDHFSALCFLQKNQERTASKRDILSVIYRLIYQENIYSTFIFLGKM